MTKRFEEIAATSVGPVAYQKYFASGVRGQETVRDDLQFPGVVCTKEEDQARQEYLLSSDLAYQVQRFGVGQFPGRYGEQDMDLLDATTAMELVRESQDAWLRLPRVLRDRYQSWANIEAAAASGELEQVLKAAGVSTAVVEAPVASPSESAAGEGSRPDKGS